MKRFAETFFRYWLIALVPVLMLPAVYYAGSREQPKTLVATTKIWVDQSIASSTTGAYYNTWMTPAQNEADTLTQLLQLSSFQWSAAHGSPLYTQLLSHLPNPTSYLTNDLNKNAQFTAAGNDLVAVSFTCACKDWRVPQQMVQSLATTALNQTLLLNQQQTTSGISYYQSQLQGARKRLSQSSKQLSTYMTQHGISNKELSTQILVDATLATLYQQAQADQQTVASIQQQITKLESTQSPSGSAVQSGLRIVDTPTLTVISSKKKTLMSLALFAALGLLLSAGLIVVKTLMDRSLHYADEVPQLFDLPVLAILPYNAALAVPARSAVRTTKKDSPSLQPASLQHGGQ